MFYRDRHIYTHTCYVTNLSVSGERQRTRGGRFFFKRDLVVLWGCPTWTPHDDDDSGGGALPFTCMFMCRFEFEGVKDSAWGGSVAAKGDACVSLVWPKEKTY
jgi:hypothetical protein